MSLYSSGAIYHLYTESSDSKSFSFLGSGNTFGLLSRTGNTEYRIELENRELICRDNDPKSDLDFRLVNNFRSMKLSMDRQEGFFRLHADITALQAEGQLLWGYSATLGIPLQEKKFSTIEVSLSSQVLPVSFQAAYLTESLHVSNPISFTSLTQWYRYKYGKSLLSFGYTRSFPHPEDKGNQYSVYNKLKAEGWMANVHTDGVREKFYLDFRTLTLRADAVLNDGGLQYANIFLNYLAYYYGRAEYIRYWANREQLKIGATLFYLDGKLVGHLEAWPFSTVVQSLFVNRIYFRALGKVSLQSVDGSFIFPEGPFILSPLLSIIRVQPEIHIETWRPEFLVFGMTDFTNSGLDITDAGLALLRLSCAYSTNFFRMTFEADQIIPIYTIKSKSTEQQNPAPAPIPAARHVVDGGRWFTVTVGIPLSSGSRN